MNEESSLHALPAHDSGPLPLGNLSTEWSRRWMC